MRRARFSLLASIALLATLLAVPAGVLAADPLIVTGTVVRDGQPVTGVRVTVTVAGGDTIAEATTDDAGSFTVEAEGGVGSELTIAATGQAFTSEPDAKGCIHSETPIGSLSTTVEAVPPAPLTVVLDGLRTSTVCSATATPRVTPSPVPRITPPATDGPVAGPPASGPGGGLLLVLGVLALGGGGALVLASRRR